MATLASSPIGPGAEIARKLQTVDVTQLNIWGQLDALSTHTRIEGVDVPAEGIVFEGDELFSGVMNIYVSLQYGNNDIDGFTTSDSFLATFKGRIFDGQPEILETYIDTSAFYGE